MKKIVDPNLLAKLEGKQPVPTPAPKIKAESKEVTDAELLEKLEADNKRLTTVNELLNNAIDVKVIEVPKRVEVPSAALGVNIGLSTNVKSLESKKSLIALII